MLEAEPSPHNTWGDSQLGEKTDKENKGARRREREEVLNGPTGKTQMVGPESHRWVESRQLEGAVKSRPPESCHTKPIEKM